MKIEDVVRMVKYPALNRTAAEEDEARGIILDALEKQKPKEARYEYTDGTGACDGCGQVMPKGNRYCHHCGQAMKWLD